MVRDADQTSRLADKDANTAADAQRSARIDPF
jgi:hypothetical protein